MSITATYDHMQRRVVARVEGPVTIDQIRNHLEDERQEPGLAYSEMIDARGCCGAVRCRHTGARGVAAMAWGADEARPDGCPRRDGLPVRHHPYDRNAGRGCLRGEAVSLGVGCETVAGVVTPR